MSDQRDGRHILVLSDDEDMRLVIGDVLVDEGYRVSHGPYLTGNADDVFRARPDAIVIDCNRKELDGSVSFLRAVRAQPHLRDIPIVASTSAVRIIDDFQREMDELDLYVLRKPFDLDRLVDVVSECFSSRPSHAS